MLPLLWIAAGFACGALPFSVWVGRWATGKDIRTVGDHNPGATNVLRTGNKWAGLVALLLDMIKGAIPVGMAFHSNGITGAWLIPVALAPVAGHAFTPFLGGRGGKAVAVTGGIWAGLTAWEGPLIGSLGLVIATRILGANGWAVLAAMTALILYLLLTPPAWNGLVARPDRWLMLGIWLGNVILLAWKHAYDLRIPPKLQLTGLQTGQDRGDA